MSRLANEPETMESRGRRMESQRYAIRVIDDIHDPQLVRHWKRIQEETDCFPQMHYEWCEPWWRLRSGKRKLHIVAVEDATQKIVGIAPLCIERRFGLRVLRSFPVHFGDFYFFLAEEGEERARIHEAIIDYATNFSAWRVVHLFNVNIKSPTSASLIDRSFIANEVTAILAATFSGMSFGEYLASLSARTRQQFRRKSRRLGEQGNVTLERVDDAAGYAGHAEAMSRIYSERWADDYSLPPDDAYYRCRTEAVQSLFAKRLMTLFVLKMDGVPCAFRLGFTYRQKFYGWKVVHDPRLADFSPGFLVTGKVIENLIAENYTEMNFMAGDYPWKRSWAPDGPQSMNHEFFACDGSLRARLYLKYHLAWRDRLRARYSAMLEIRWVRALKRWLEAQRRRFRR